MRLVVSENLQRHKLWSKERVAEDLKSTQLTIKNLCKLYAPSPEKWRGFYNDIWKWRKLDPDFNVLVLSHMKKTSPTRKGTGGRPKKDGGDKSWQQLFCEELVRQNGNRHKASLVTPYSFETINQMLTPQYTEYDEKFARMVRATELQLAAYAEELIMSTLAPENFDSLETAKIAQTKAWIASKVLEKLDDSRWGKKMNIDMRGEIRHTALNGARQNLIANLVDEQQMFMQKRGLALPAARDIVDAEVVSEQPLETK